MTAYQVPIGWTRSLNSRMVNELRMGFARDNSQAEQDPFGLNHTADYVPGVPVNPAFDGGVPMITFANLNTFIGSPNFLPKHQVTQQYQFTDTLRWTRSAHQITIGGEFGRGLDDVTNNFRANGRFTFNGGSAPFTTDSFAGLRPSDFPFRW